MKRPTLLLALLLGTTSPRAAVPTIAIDASSSAGKVSPLLYGLMTEEINHSYDGGLYAELVQNRAFLDDAASPVHWSPILGDGAAATMALDKEQPLNAVIDTTLRLDVTRASAGHAAGIANEGYWHRDSPARSRFGSKVKTSTPVHGEFQNSRGVPVHPRFGPAANYPALMR
jgi:hypothetical protein